MKKLFIVFIFILVTVNLYSNPADTVLAKTIAKNYFEFLNPLRSNIEIKNTITIYYNGYPSYYIINFIDGGNITVSANNTTVPILAYSYGGEYNENDFHNPAYLDWMENYSKEIDSVRIYNIPNDSTIQEWNNILNKNFSQYKSTKSVQPLITTKWGQSVNKSGECLGYNYFCPSFTASEGCNCQRCNAGCGPIAMAQVMKYWMHPVHSTYQDYDWCNMHDELTNSSTMTEVKAVARLIRDCGDKANVNYCVAEWAGGCYTSLWPPSKAKNALVDDLGYSDDAYVAKRAYYTKKKWIKKLKNDLDNGKPVIYASLQFPDTWNGHYFIIDGYNTDDKFHINWGWRGTDNDYYDIGELKPPIVGGNYNWKRRAIFNLHPAWYINCNSVLQVLQIYEVISSLSHLYYNPVKGTIIAGGSGAPLTIQSGQTVHYRAYNRIELKDGFVAEEGSNFVAEIISCPAECNNSDIKSEIFSDNYVWDNTNFNYQNSEKDIKKINYEFEFQVYPNPFEKRTNIIYTVKENEKFDISIYNIYGIKLYSLINGIQPAGKYNLLYDTSNLPNGVYICIFSSKNRREIIKLLKY